MENFIKDLASLYLLQIKKIMISVFHLPHEQSGLLTILHFPFDHRLTSDTNFQITESITISIS